MYEKQVEKIKLDEFEIGLRRSSRRKTLEIAVERNGAVVINAPADLPLSKILDLAKKKKVWILNKATEKQILLRSVRTKEYVSGETFHFLGRPYRLRIVDAEKWNHRDPVVLDEGRLMVDKMALGDAPAAVARWYCNEGKEWLADRVAGLAPRVGRSPRGLRVLDLGYRWASCSSNGVLNFHWKVMTLPPRMIDYLIVHELVHLIEKNHGADFWRRVSRIMSDFSTRKEWLAKNGAEMAG